MIGFWAKFKYIKGTVIQGGYTVASEGDSGLSPLAGSVEGKVSLNIERQRKKVEGENFCDTFFLSRVRIVSVYCHDNTAG